MSIKFVYKYKYDNIQYNRMRYDYKNYEIDFEIHQNDKLWIAELESYDDNVVSLCFQSVNKDNCLHQFMIFINDIINNGLVKHYQDKQYKIYPAFEDVLCSVRDLNIGYHVAEASVHNSILQNGLIGSETPSDDVVAASKLIHHYKRFWIPNWVDRRKALYVYPVITNYHLADECSNRNLYAVNLQIEQCWVGSQGLGGFCLDASYIEELNLTPVRLKERLKDLKQHAKDYWLYSCSLQSYIKNGWVVRYKNYQFGLDEILVLHPIKSFELIGAWDNNGIFCENDNFKKYVKPSLKNNYQDILSKY